jgi:NAD(P)-dependent dehydrogenase (short-subunit alcohol dehydrogenase family)
MKRCGEAHAPGPPAFSVYSAPKAAVPSFECTFITDRKHRKIRVNAISPGVIPSAATAIPWE